MWIDGKLLVLAVLCSVVLTEKLLVEHEERDTDVIRKTLEEVVKRPSIQFVEYGPDGEEGYKYHLAAGDDKEYIIHTTVPVSIPIVESITGSREERDRKLLKRLIQSPKIKSMESVKSKSDKE